MAQSEEVSRRDEIRAIFILGLLAVLSSIRVQYYSTNTPMTIQFTYGSFNLLPFLDNIILLWSLYAFFMVLGLSGDIIGNRVANGFRDISKIFLQWNFLILGAFSMPIAFIAYGDRFFFIVVLIILAFVVALSCALLFKKQVKLKNRIKPFFTRKNVPVALALIFILFSYIIIGYPKDWIASVQVSFIAFVISAVTVTVLLFLEARKEEDTSYKSDEDYYY